MGYAGHHQHQEAAVDHGTHRPGRRRRGTHHVGDTNDRTPIYADGGTAAHILQVMLTFDPLVRITAPPPTQVRPPIHDLAPCRSHEGQWNGAFLYHAPDRDALNKTRTQLHNLCLNTTHATTRFHLDTRLGNLPLQPPPSPRPKNGLEGRFGGSLSSFQQATYHTTRFTRWKERPSTSHPNFKDMDFYHPRHLRPQQHRL